MTKDKTITVRLSDDAFDLLVANEGKNRSAFLDELLLDTLQDRNYWGRKFNKAVTEARFWATKLKKDIVLEIKNEGLGA